MQINRLFGIIYILLDRQSITAKELAARFEVSARTIYRDIDALSAAGIPIYASQGKGGGISLMEEYILNKSMLSENEQNEILYALQSVAIAQVPEADKLLAKLSHFFNKNETNWIEVDFSPWGSGKERTREFASLKTAILNRRIIEFNYVDAAGKSSRRKVEPAKLSFKVRAWYLQGFCLEQNALELLKFHACPLFR